jgi:hypothetical protein
MTGLGMAVAGLVWLVWGVYLYRSPNVLERARRLPLGRSQFFRTLLELIALGAFPEGLGFLAAGSAQALGASVVGLFAFIIGNLILLALWLMRPNWAKPRWMQPSAAKQT